MTNIVDATIELLDKKDGLVTIQEIIANLDNEKLNNISESKLEAYIHMDLMKDGRFLLVEDKWGLANDYTQQEITRERYRQLGKQITDEDDTFVEEEVELRFEIDENYLDEEVIDINFDDFENEKVSFIDED